MARWDPGTQDRLREAAMSLFARRGYDGVTVTEIAEAAGLTRRSFFRYFTDKREVLFDGSERLPPALTEAVVRADASLPAAAAALEAMSSVGIVLLDTVGKARQRRNIIAGSADLQERERTKLAAMGQALSEGLHLRGMERSAAELLGQIAATVFDSAYGLSLEDTRPAETFPVRLREAMGTVAHFAAASDAAAPRTPSGPVPPAPTTAVHPDG